MKKEKLKEIIEAEDDAKNLIFEICNIASPSDADKTAQQLLSTTTVPEEVFVRAYRSVNSHDSYSYLKTKALFKLMYMLDLRMRRPDKRSIYDNKKKVAVLDEIIEYAVSHFDMLTFEKLIVFKITKDCCCSAVYESSSSYTDSCYIHTDELFSILKESDGDTFVIMHSHPFGDPSPSESDAYMHNDIKKFFSLSNSFLLEHIIVSEKNGKVNYCCMERPAEYYKDIRILDLIRQ